MDGTLYQSVNSRTIGMAPGAEQQPHLRRLERRDVYSMGDCLNAESGGERGLGSICLVSWPISMSVGGGNTAFDRPKIYFSTQSITVRNVGQNSSIQYSPWALRPTIDNV